MKSKFIKIVTMAASCVLAAAMLAGCGGETDNPGSQPDNTMKITDETVKSNVEATAMREAVSGSEAFSQFDKTVGFVEAEAALVELADDASKASAKSVKISGNSIQFTAGGTYIVYGKLSYGRLVVNISKEEKIRIILAGVDITNPEGPAFLVMSADKVGITLADNTVNKFTDGANYTDQASGAPNACIYSDDDIIINGFGTLEVTGNFNNAVSSNNDIKVVSGTLKITAVNHGLKGKDSVRINSGDITITANKDGIKSSSTKAEDKGYVLIEGGNIEITAGDDAIQAVTAITISAGSVTTHAVGKATNCDGVKTIAEGTLTKA